MTMFRWVSALALACLVACPATAQRVPGHHVGESGIGSATGCSYNDSDGTLVLCSPRTPQPMQQRDPTGAIVDPRLAAPVKLPDGLYLTPPAVTTAGSWYNGIFPRQDASGYAAAIVDVLIAPASGGNMLTCGWSNDGATYWYAAVGYQVDNDTMTKSRFPQLTGIASFAYPRLGRYFTCFLVTASGGPVVINVMFQSTPVVHP